jgi:hypothetical protein
VDPNQPEQTEPIEECRAEPESGANRKTVADASGSWEETVTENSALAELVRDVPQTGEAPPATTPDCSIGQRRKENRDRARNGNEDATKLQGNDNEEASNRQRTGKQTSAETSPAAAKRAERLGFARLQTLGRLFLVLKLLELYISAIIWCAQKRRTCENGQNRVILIADRSSQPVCM